VLTCFNSSSPQHSITDSKCKQFTFQICEEIAQKSDAGRKALIDDGILPVLLRLAKNHIGVNVVNACKILNALAHSGTYRETLIEGGAKKVMENITRCVFYTFTKLKVCLIKISPAVYSIRPVSQIAGIKVRPRTLQSKFLGHSSRQS
jgi:hypothetical protein